MFYPLPALINLVLFFCLGQSDIFLSPRHFNLDQFLHRSSLERQSTSPMLDRNHQQSCPKSKP
jgi:hypothetical protein